MTKKSDPLVSILIPTYMRAAVIERTITSAINQSYENIEIIVFDNASDDGTRSKVEAISLTDPRVKFYAAAENFGPIANWQSCFERSKGSLIKFLWSDDYLDELCIEKMVYSLTLDKSAGFAISEAKLLDADLNLQGVQYKNRVGKKFYFEDFVASMALRLPHLPYSPAAALLRRHIVEAVFSQKEIIGSECNKKAIGLDLHLIYRAFEDYTYGISSGGSVNLVGSIDSISILERGVVLNDCYFSSSLSLIEKINSSYIFPYILLRSCRSVFGGKRHHISYSLINLIRDKTSGFGLKDAILSFKLLSISLTSRFIK